MKEILLQLFKNLNANDVTYGVLRGYENLPEEVYNDIDFGVSKSQINLFFHIVEETLEGFELKEVHYLRKDVLYQKYFYNSKTNRHLHIDVWCEFSYKGLRYLNFDSALNSNIYYKNIRVLNNSYEVSLSFLKEFLHMGKLRQDKATLLGEKLSKASNKLNPVKSYFSESSHNFFIKSIQTRLFELKEYRNKYILKLFIANIRKHGFYCFINIFRYYNFELKNYFSPKGKFVCLVGPDGSGKTACYNIIKDDVCSIKYNKLVYFHSRFGKIPRLKDLFRFKSKNEIDYNQINDKRRDASQNIYSKTRTTVYMVYYFWDFIIGHFIIRYHKYKNNLIVFDRYYYDYFFQTNFSKYPKILKPIFKLLLPHPDHILILKANPLIIFQRKPELPINEIELQYSKIDKLFARNTNTYEIDTNSQSEKMKISLANILLVYEKK